MSNKQRMPCPECGLTHVRFYPKKIEKKVYWECKKCMHDWETDMEDEKNEKL